MGAEDRDWGPGIGDWSFRSIRTPFLIVVFFLYCALASVPGHATSLSPEHSVLSPTVDKQEADPQFPGKVTFTLKAHGFVAEKARLNYRLVGYPITSEEEASIGAPSGDLDLSVTLDLPTHYIPPGADVTYYWTLTDASGEEADTQAKTFKMADDRYTWQTLSDSQRRVSVHWHKGNTRFGQKIVNSAASTLDDLQNELGVGLQRPAEIWVYPGQDELIGALPHNQPEWIGGEAFPALSVVLGHIEDDSTATFEIERLIPHELSHLFLYQATQNPYNSPPAWFDEGLAVYHQGVLDLDSDGLIKDAAQGGYLIPLKALSGSFSADEDTARLSYAESYSVMNFIMNDERYGPSRLARTVAAFKDGVTYDEALDAGLGVNVDDLDQQWRASLPFPIATPGGIPIKHIRSDDPAGGNLPLYIGAGTCTAILLVVAVFAGVVLLRRRQPT